MTIYSGQLISGPEVDILFGNADLGLRIEPFDNYLTVIDMTYAGFGTSASTQPIDEAANTHAGSVAQMFGFLDWYNRIHLQYQLVNLGAVVSNQEVTLRVFNAFFVNRTLNEIIVTPDQGIVVIDPDTTPYDYLPLEERTYTIQVSSSGPFRILASVIFDFDNRDYDVTVNGVRVVAWRWEPNWEPGIRERLEWNTRVLEAFDGSEQRASMRLLPKQYWEFEFDIEGEQLRIFEATLYDWGSRTWALPVWPDVEVFKTTLLDGAVEIPVSTATRAYRVGGLVTLISHDSAVHEALEISAVNVDSVETVTPTTRDWGPGTKVYPTVLSHIENAVQLSRFIVSYGYGVAQFRSDAGVEYEALDETLYRSYPVLEDVPDLRPDPSQTYERKQTVLDYQTGLSFVDDESELMRPVFLNRWAMMSRDEIDHFRKWLYSRAGRFKGIWVPTFADNLRLASTQLASESTIDFEYAGLVLFSRGDIHRRDIRIELNDSTVLYRRIVDPVTVDDTTERMTLGTILGVDVEPEDVRLISWMSLCRLDSDSVEISWDAPYIAESMTALKGYRSDV